jgi:hypothetical protein
LGGREVVRREGELSRRAIDRDWPHQVALHADKVKGVGGEIIREFCRDLSLSPRGRSVARDDGWYVVFCFADPAQADLFRERVGGERFEPKDCGRGHSWHIWRNR